MSAGSPTQFLQARKRSKRSSAPPSNISTDPALSQSPAPKSQQPPLPERAQPILLRPQSKATYCAPYPLEPIPLPSQTIPLHVPPQALTRKLSTPPTRYSLADSSRRSASTPLCCSAG